MTYLEEKKFFFESSAPGIASDSFAVVSFKGDEALSGLYEFDISLVSSDPEIDLEAILSHPATLYLRPNQKLPIHGIISSFEQMNQVGQNAFYRAILVPKLWQLTQYYMSEVYLQSTFPEILEQVLQDGGLSTNDYRLELSRLNESHPFQFRRWSYVCQFEETYFDFISRWMEREGIYYFFEQGDSSETLVITDSKMIHAELPPGRKKVHFSPVSGLETSQQDNIATSITCRRKPLPQKVVLQDFNHRKSPPIIEGEAEVSASGRGEVYLYGEHVKNIDEANKYAEVRAEEILCRGQVFYGDTEAAYIRVGFFFELDRHYRSDYNQKYLLTSIHHEGSQAALMASGIRRSLSDEEKRAYYRNNIVAIPYDVQFRPERTTPKPRFHGPVNAKVSAEGTGQYAELDQYGRYKIKLPFDRSDLDGHKASRWMRSIQPLAGPNEGMHFPLRKGAEVLLSFAHGDPDRPFIAGPIPSTEDPNVVTDINFTRNLIKTSGDNSIEMNDDAGNKRIHIHTPGSLWYDSNNSYGEYVVFKGARTEANAAPGGISNLLEKMYDYNGSFKPTGMKTFVHGGSPSDEEKTIYGNPSDFDGLGSNADKWKYLVDRGHVRLQKCDKFITHEGNIYDFGGYWNYNLGNNYVENHIAQDAELNKLEDNDLMDAGGPNWSSIDWPPEDSEPSGDWGNGDIWVEKKFGNSYEFAKGGSVSVQEGDTLGIERGGKHVEWVYRGDGSKKTYSMRGGSTNIEEEKKWTSGGTLTSHSTTDNDWNDTVIITHPETAVASFSYTTWPPWFNFTASAAGIPNVSITLSASTNTTKIAIEASTTIGVNINASAKIAIDLDASLFFTIKAGAGIGMEIEGKPSTLTFKSTNGKFRWNGPGTKVEKEAAVKADMEKFALRKMMTHLTKGEMQLINLSLAVQKQVAGIEKADIKLFA